MLVQHFAMLAGERPLPLATLDTLTQLLLQMTSEVPFYAATVARARYDVLQSHKLHCHNIFLHGHSPLLVMFFSLDHLDCQWLDKAGLLHLDLEQGAAAWPH